MGHPTTKRTDDTDSDKDIEGKQLLQDFLTFLTLKSKEIKKKERKIIKLFIIFKY